MVSWRLTRPNLINHFIKDEKIHDDEDEDEDEEEEDDDTKKASRQVKSLFNDSW